MPGHRHCARHHNVFEFDDLAPEGTFAVVACGDWCYEHRREISGDYNDLDL